MPYQKVGQSIDVYMAFRQNRTEPVVFKWENRFYQIDCVNLVHTERQGSEKVYFFSVSDRLRTFRLSFRAESLGWRLEEWCDLPAR